MPSAHQHWADRVIPLPKQLQVDGVVTAAPTDVAVAWPDLSSPCVVTMRALLSSWAVGDLAAARVVIAPELVDWQDDHLPPAARKLRTVPNQNQAYAIIHEQSGGKHRFRLLATTPQGLLYATRTLTDLAHPAWRNGAALPPHHPAAALELPLATVVDWPDLADRGTHAAGFPEYNLDWEAQWKLNYFGKGGMRHAFDLNETPSAEGGLPPLILDNAKELQVVAEYAAELGVNVEPQISHIGDGQLRLIRDILEKPELSFARVVLARDGSNGEKARGLCMSNPRTIQLLADMIALNKTLLTSGRKSVCVWLTEGGNLACFCDGCRGHNGYLMEARGIHQAWQLAGGKEAGLQLRLLNSQGSYDVDEQILLTLPDVGLIYYNGYHSYSADHRALIPDYVAAATKNGRHISALIQPTPSFFAVFPGSIPQFLRWRVAEFKGKGLSGVTTWLVPDRHFFEVNMAALAEWSWNMHGRSTKDFARAFATIMGMPDPALYAEWIEHAGAAAWWLAESRFIEALCYSPSVILNPIVEEFPMDGDPRRKVFRIPALGGVIEHARKAMALADRSGDIMMRCESACVLAALYAYDLAEVIRIEHGRGTPAAELRVKIDQLELYAQQIRVYHDAWWEAVLSRKAALPKNKLYPMFGKDFGETYKVPRVSMPEYVLFRACDAWREKLALPMPVVGQWTHADFDAKGQADLSFDMTHLLSGENRGVCVILEWTKGASINHKSTGLMVSNVVSGVTRAAGEYKIGRRLNNKVEERQVEATLAAPKLAKDEKLILKVTLMLPESKQPMRYNPLTDGVDAQAEGTFTDVAGRITARPVDLLDTQLPTTGAPDQTP